MTIAIRSFAKINLGLRIGPRRGDGFHDLLTVYQTIGLHDVIRVSVGRGSGIEIVCTDPRVPRDESNTCYRIAEKGLIALNLQKHVTIEIEKRLPVQGGMGGASGNAVAALLGLERALKRSLGAAKRLRIAAEVGSDLPLFLVGGTVLGVGRGEQVYPLEDFPATACVVVTPEVGVSTPQAFAEWDRRQGLKPACSGPANAALKGRSSAEAQKLDSAARTSALRPDGQPSSAIPTQAIVKKAWTDEGVRRQVGMGELTLTKTSDRIRWLGHEMSAWLSECYTGAPHAGDVQRGRAENPLLALVRTGIKNDFEEVVFPEYPELSEGKKALERAGAKYASLSGSGSTLYGLFASKEAAGAAVVKLRRQGWTAQATVTLTRRQYWRKFLIADC